jgi:hypothetical protein
MTLPRAPPPAVAARPAPLSWKEPIVPRRTLWKIDMGDGTWAVCCNACQLPLYRGNKREADRVFRGHVCEPVVPLGRRRRSA